jgi:predicted peptidase
MIRLLQDAGGNARITIYPGANHDSWTETYNNPELYEWLLKQSRP